MFCWTYGISEVMEQTCAEAEQSQAENLEKALGAVLKGRRWIGVVGELIEAAVEMNFAMEYYKFAVEHTG